MTTEANDVRQLTGMLNEAQANVAAVMGEDASLCAAVADAGYWSNADSQTEECELFIATQKDHKQRAALREAPAPRGRMPRSMTARERMDRKLRTKRAGPVCLNNFSASISGASAGVRLPSGGAAG